MSARSHLFGGLKALEEQSLAQTPVKYSPSMRPYSILKVPFQQCLPFACR